MPAVHRTVAPSRAARSISLAGRPNVLPAEFIPARGSAGPVRGSHRESVRASVRRDEGGLEDWAQPIEHVMSEPRAPRKSQSARTPGNAMQFLQERVFALTESRWSPSRNSPAIPGWDKGEAGVLILLVTLLIWTSIMLIMEVLLFDNCPWRSTA